MRIFVDLETNTVSASQGAISPIDSLEFKRTLTSQVDVLFTRGGLVVELPSDAAGILGFKPTGKYDADYLTAGLLWVKTGTGADTVYTFTVGFINPTLDALFFVDSNLTNDVAELTAMAELEWSTGGNFYKSQTMVVHVANDVNRGGETLPALPLAAVGVFLPNITRRVGGTAIDLNAVPTIKLRLGLIVTMLDVANNRWLSFVLKTGSASLTYDVQPLDHDNVTNNKYWAGAAIGDVGPTGPTGPTGAPDPNDSADVTASEDITALSLVTVDGKVANSNTIAHFNKVIGIAMSSVLTGAIATLIVEGEVTDPSWSWSPGSRLFLNGTTLSLTAPTSGFSQMIAVARSSQTIFIRLQPPVLL